MKKSLGFVPFFRKGKKWIAYGIKEIVERHVSKNFHGIGQDQDELEKHLRMY